MEELERLARSALVEAQRRYEDATRQLRDARAAADAGGDLAALSASLGSARVALGTSREAYHRAAEVLKMALGSLTESTTRFERAEAAVRKARAAAGDPTSARLVAEEIARLEADLEHARRALEAAGKRLADERRSP